MMQAAALLPVAQNRGVEQAAEPLALIDGVYEPRLRVAQYEATAPLDDRRVLLEWLDDAAPCEALPSSSSAAAAPAHATIALAHHLRDGVNRVAILAHGQLEQVQNEGEPGAADTHYQLIDAWQTALAAPPRHVVVRDATGSLTSQNNAFIRNAPAPNRSADRYAIAGAQAHVPQAGGEIWTVAQALNTLAALAGIELGQTLLPVDIQQARLAVTLDLSRPLGELLGRVAEAHGLVVQRSLTWSAGRILEKRALRPDDTGRVIRLDNIARRRFRRTLAGAERWTAQAAGWLVESTFPLARGWDASLEGEADDAYNRTTSSDFARYRDVYRQWVLNEDGAFTAAPFDAGAAFDLAALFEDVDTPVVAAPFEPCVTLDETGAPLPPLVQISTDSGGSWSAYPGRALVLEDRAGVYLDDDALPAAFLAAAKAGAARVRITAGLRSAKPVRLTRWRGNAFRGSGPGRRIDFGQTFAFRRIDSASIHAADVAAGLLQSRAVDDTHAMARQLVAQLRRADRARRTLARPGTLTLDTAMPLLRVGDRLPVAWHDVPPLFAHTPDARDGFAGVRGLRCTFGVADTAGPCTRIELA